jgi:hypothetical protein
MFPLSLGILPIAIAVLLFGLFRAKKLGAPKLSVAVLQLLVTVSAVGGWFALRTADYLAGPPDGDLYAQTWGFQTVVFTMLYLPWTLLAVGSLIVIQSYGLQRGHRNER